MNILVTGGAGFIGSHTAVELLQAGHTPIILDNFSNSSPDMIKGVESIMGKFLTFYKIDCLDQNALSTVFRENTIDGIIHFVAKKSVGESVKAPLVYWRNNMDSLLTLLEYAIQFQVRAFLFSSSATVYGEPDTLPIPETAPRKPSTSPYGSTKQAGEDILKDVVSAPTHQLKGISLRYFNPIGAHPSAKIGELPIGTPQNLIPYITQTASRKRDILTLFGNDYDTADGTCLRDYIHVSDLARAHVVAIEYALKTSSPTYDVFNIGTGTPHSVMDTIKTFEKVNGVSVPYTFGARRPGDVMSCYADPTKAHKLLQWKARYSFEDALRHAWEWEKTLEENTTSPTL